ncbi:MerR family transcriptional regulator [Rhizobium sp. SSA_523]|uniref:MerR family transcriptional regulator n=1 Tax=Rhizobium sp. SSA_523 TaxID=2952477 RepID=UPI00209106E8|nr:MerR family transcriptional regulator [Rhizobium sp. SSA_523]MCO5730241.1 MerR family transcriptional regulator [Rhizobium sp. SSA_523]WKC25297.1 MerR family transcriptional regulator [Rhizobium sp. SSA_523]
MQADVPQRERGQALSDLAGRSIAGFLPDIARPLPASEAPLAIADMADLFGVTHRTLHFYEEKMLITAQRFGQMRVYDGETIRRMAVICACRDIGMSLSAIQALMQALGQSRSQDEADRLFATVLEERRREITSDLSQINRQIRRIRVPSEKPQEGKEPEGEAQAPSAARAPLPAVSDLERSFLALTAEGLAGAELSRRLGLAPGDLARLEAELLKRLESTNRFQAAAKAMVIGILPH